MTTKKTPKAKPKTEQEHVEAFQKAFQALLKRQGATMTLVVEKGQIITQEGHAVYVDVPKMLLDFDL